MVQQANQILPFDDTMTGGFTVGRKLAKLCELNHVHTASHHDYFVHAHVVTGRIAGGIVESCTDAECDPLQAQLFVNPPRIDNARYVCSAQPRRGAKRRFNFEVQQAYPMVAGTNLLDSLLARPLTRNCTEQPG